MGEVWSESGKVSFIHSEWTRIFMVSFLWVSRFLVALVSWKEEMFIKCGRIEVGYKSLLHSLQWCVTLCWCMLSSALSIIWTPQRSKLQLSSWPCVWLVALLGQSMTQIHIISFYDSYYLWDLKLPSSEQESVTDVNRSWSIDSLWMGNKALSFHQYRNRKEQNMWDTWVYIFTYSLGQSHFVLA